MPEYTEPVDTSDRYIVVIDGADLDSGEQNLDMTFFGPFDSVDAAHKWAEDALEDGFSMPDYSVCAMTRPEVF